MDSRVSEQIENINRSLEWIRKYHPEDYEVKFVNLARKRSELQTVKEAAETNPAIAAFGKSQVGKSYMMSCILQKSAVGEGGRLTTEIFMVEANGKRYDFIKEINPIGDDKEATGVVTRFSSLKKYHDVEYRPEYPVIVKCLSLSELVTIISDSYYHDLANFSSPGESEVLEACRKMKEKYLRREPEANPHVTVDQVFVMGKYFSRHINAAQVFKRGKDEVGNFFNELALVIDRIPCQDYEEVFSILWNRNEKFTRLYRRIYGILERLNFARFIYLPIEAVLHDGKKENTIMSVECLKNLNNAEYRYSTEVYMTNSAGRLASAGTFFKSEICAVTAETVFRIHEDFLESTKRYCMDAVTDSVRSRVSAGDIKMSLLNDNDLLDFPGARSRLWQDVDRLTEGEDSILNCLLRGKVAYLFNSYNESLLINVLMFCHHNKNNDVSELWQLLNTWVKTYVGETAKDRRAMLEQTEVSPLFFIATMFNLDMECKGSDVEDSRNAIERRWTGRFNTVVNTEVFNKDSVDWVTNWSGENVPFNNSYLLRDFKYSGTLYDGFRSEKQETQMIISREHYDTLRDTFIHEETVRSLFSDPEKAWELAATINNDGSLYIIENLSKVAVKMNAAREKLFQNILAKHTAACVDEIKDYYVPTNNDELLAVGIRKAKSVFRELSFTCNADNYYFGHLIQAMQTTESRCYQTVHSLMLDPDALNAQNNFDNYEIIREDCKNSGHPLDACPDTDACWEAVMATYGFETRQVAEEYLASKNVDPEMLFTRKYRQLKNSNIISDRIYSEWCEGLMSVNFIGTFTGEHSFSSSVMSEFVGNIIRISRSVGLNELMAGAISEYVDVTDVHKANESLISDILADVINDFVLDFGYSNYDESKVNSLRKTAEANNLPVFKYICRESPAVFDEARITELFDDMASSPQALILPFKEHYYRWIEYMYISYIADIDMPDCDPAANAALMEIMERMKTTANAAA